MTDTHAYALVATILGVLIVVHLVMLVAVHAAAGVALPFG